MYYAKIENNKIVGKLFVNVRELCPDYSFPSIITKECLPDSVVVVEDEPTPYFDVATQKIIIGEPYQDADQWKVGWVIVELSQNEKDEIRQSYEDAALNTRNRLLLDSDWTQGKDIPDETSNKWVKYRQDLRDVTKQTGYPFHIIWPSPPL